MNRNTQQTRVPSPSHSSPQQKQHLAQGQQKEKERGGREIGEEADKHTPDLDYKETMLQLRRVARDAPQKAANAYRESLQYLLEKKDHMPVFLLLQEFDKHSYISVDDLARVMEVQARATPSDRRIVKLCDHLYQSNGLPFSTRYMAARVFVAAREGNNDEFSAKVVELIQDGGELSSRQTVSLLRLFAKERNTEGPLILLKTMKEAGRRQNALLQNSVIGLMHQHEAGVPLEEKEPLDNSGPFLALLDVYSEEGNVVETIQMCETLAFDESLRYINPTQFEHLVSNIHNAMEKSPQVELEATTGIEGIVERILKLAVERGTTLTIQHFRVFSSLAGYLAASGDTELLRTFPSLMDRYCIEPDNEVYSNLLRSAVLFDDSSITGPLYAHMKSNGIFPSLGDKVWDQRIQRSMGMLSDHKQEVTVARGPRPSLSDPTSPSSGSPSLSGDGTDGPLGRSNTTVVSVDIQPPKGGEESGRQRRSYEDPVMRVSLAVGDLNQLRSGSQNNTPSLDQDAPYLQEVSQIEALPTRSRQSDPSKPHSSSLIRSNVGVVAKAHFFDNLLDESVKAGRALDAVYMLEVMMADNTLRSRAGFDAIVKLIARIPDVSMSSSLMDNLLLRSAPLSDASFKVYFDSLRLGPLEMDEDTLEKLSALVVSSCFTEYDESVPSASLSSSPTEEQIRITHRLSLLLTKIVPWETIGCDVAHVSSYFSKLVEEGRIRVLLRHLKAVCSSLVENNVVYESLSLVEMMLRLAELNEEDLSEVLPLCRDIALNIPYIAAHVLGGETLSRYEEGGKNLSVVDNPMFLLDHVDQTRSANNLTRFILLDVARHEDSTQLCDMVEFMLSTNRMPPPNMVYDVLNHLMRQCVSDVDRSSLLSTYSGLERKTMVIDRTSESFRRANVIASRFSRLQRSGMQLIQDYVMSGNVVGASRIFNLLCLFDTFRPTKNNMESVVNMTLRSARHPSVDHARALSLLEFACEVSYRFNVLDMTSRIIDQLMHMEARSSDEEYEKMNLTTRKLIESFSVAGIVIPRRARKDIIRLLFEQTSDPTKMTEREMKTWLAALEYDFSLNKGIGSVEQAVERFIRPIMKRYQQNSNEKIYSFLDWIAYRQREMQTSNNGEREGENVFPLASPSIPTDPLITGQLERLRLASRSFLESINVSSCMASLILGERDTQPDGHLKDTHSVISEYRNIDLDKEYYDQLMDVCVRLVDIPWALVLARDMPKEYLLESHIGSFTSLWNLALKSSMSTAVDMVSLIVYCSCRVVSCGVVSCRVVSCLVDGGCQNSFSLSPSLSLSLSLSLTHSPPFCLHLSHHRSSRWPSLSSLLPSLTPRSQR